MKIDNIQAGYDGAYIKLFKAHCTHNKKSIIWEYVSRKSDQSPEAKDKADAVIILAVINGENAILIKQFRPPINDYVIECPAGLIDEGETAGEAALRELKEETGYVGTISKEVPITLYNSPGITDESIQIVMVDVEAGQTPEPANEGGEDIEVILVPLTEVADFIKQDNMKIGAKCFMFLMIIEALK